MAYDPTDLDAQHRAKAVQAQRQQRAREEEEADVRWLMGSRRGRRIVWRVLDRAGVFRISFNTNAMTMAFNEGMRNEGLRLLGMVHAECPDHYVDMLKEANERSATNADDAGSNT